MVNWNDDEPQQEQNLPFEVPEGMSMIGGDQALEFLRNFMSRPTLFFSNDEAVINEVRHLRMPDAIITSVPDDPTDLNPAPDAPMHQVMMFNMMTAAGVLGAAVMHEKDVVALRDMLNAWLQYPKEAILTREEAAVWVNSSMHQLHSDDTIVFRWGLFQGVWREWDEANDYVDHKFGEGEEHDAWEPPGI